MDNKVFDLKAKKGDIIFPTQNGTAGFTQKPEWLIVTNTIKGRVQAVSVIRQTATLRAIEILKEHPELIKIWQKRKRV